MIIEFMAKNHDTCLNFIAHWRVSDNVSLPDLVQRYKDTHDLYAISADGDELQAVWHRVWLFCDANAIEVIQKTREGQSLFVQSWSGNIAKFIAMKLFAVPVSKIRM